MIRNRSRTTMPAILALTITFVGGARADFIADSVNDTKTPGAGTWGAGVDVGWFYTPSTSYTLIGIETKFGTPTDGRIVTEEFFDLGPRSDGGTVLGTATFTPIADTFAGSTFSPVNLIAGHQYFLGFRNVSGLGWNFTTDSGATPLSALRFDSDGTGFYALTANDADTPILEFVGQSVPEPTTLVMLCTGILGILTFKYINLNRSAAKRRYLHSAPSSHPCCKNAPFTAPRMDSGGHPTRSLAGDVLTNPGPKQTPEREMRRIPIFASIPGNEHRLARFALQAALLLSVYIIAAQRAEGGIIADFGADMQPNTPATGWSYLWNPTGVQIRDAAHYRELGAVPQPNQIYYDTDGSAPLPRPDPGAYLYFGGDGTTGDGHPGRGSSQSADGLEHYAIAAFTVAVDGQFSIVDSVVTTTNSSVYGIHLRIFVDDHDTGVNVDTGSGNHSVSFDTNLGYLHDGDTIYVAVGAGASDFDDSFNLGYQISLSSVPEPSSVVLILLGGLASLCYSRPRRR